LALERSQLKTISYQKNKKAKDKGGFVSLLGRHLLVKAPFPDEARIFIHQFGWSIFLVGKIDPSFCITPATPLHQCTINVEIEAIFAALLESLYNRRVLLIHGSYSWALILGSTTVKAVVLNGQVLASAIRPTGANPRKAGEAVLEQVLERSKEPIDRIVATGYGRVSFSADDVVSEITAHAKGSNLLFPDARTVIDIGGQDSKITGLQQLRTKASSRPELRPLWRCSGLQKPPKDPGNKKSLEGKDEELFKQSSK